MADKQPNILILMTDELRHPPIYEPDEVKRFRHETLTAEESLRKAGVSFECHYTMSAACAPSRASLLTGHYPSLHGVTQTDGLAKDADSPEMFWLAPDTVPTMGDWFRAGGYRTFYKGKWHASHAHLPSRDGKGYLQSMNDDGSPIAEGVMKYLEADLLDAYGFSEWVGPEPHGVGKRNTATAKDPFTANETIALLQRLGREKSEQPWLTVCSFLNPHDIAIFGLVGLAQGLKYDYNSVPHIPDAPTRDEDLSTKPACQQSYVDVWKKMLAPQPWVEAHRRYYYQLQRTVDEQMARVLDALRASGQFDDTIIVFTTDHGEMLGAHGGMHQKWHNAYQESIHIPLVVAGRGVKDGGREVRIPTSHADLLPTLLGLAGIDREAALVRVAADHKEARPLVGRDLSAVILHGSDLPAPDPVLFVTEDEISEGSAQPGSPFQRVARWVKAYEDVVQPNHVETVVARVDVDGEPHLVKFSRYHDNPQFWTVPGARDERLQRRQTVTVTEPAPDEFELYDLSVDPLEQHNLAWPGNADDKTRKLQAHMFELLRAQLAAKRLEPASGGLTGYRPPASV